MVHRVLKAIVLHNSFSAELLNALQSALLHGCLLCIEIISGFFEFVVKGYRFSLIHFSCGSESAKPFQCD